MPKVDLDYTKTYWAQKGLLQPLVGTLSALVAPLGDETPEHLPKLKRYRDACWLYYDLYNNGGCNAGKEIASFFGPGMKAFNKGEAEGNAFIRRVDMKMDKVILEAYHEFLEVMNNGN